MAVNIAELRSLSPPSSLIAKAAGRSAFSWLAIGDGWVESMREWADLAPGDRVLDVGCGMGRMAIALASYLGDRGSYEGFDVQRSAIDWCKREIEPRWPHSRFQLVEVRSRQYRRRGVDAARFRFPYADAQFDFVLLTSVFTHMVRDEVENYLREIRRVLAPGGRSLVTYYLLDESARRAVAEGRGRYRFAREVAPGCYVERRFLDPIAVAYDEHVLSELYREAGLAEPTIHHGAWSGAHPDASHGQDTLVTR